jgi:general secretion pathway protein C
MRRRGGEFDGKTVSFIAADRVWLVDSRGLCQAGMWGSPAAAQVPTAPRPGSPLTEELRTGIHSTSPTSFNVERQVVEKVLEHGAELMAGSHVVPEASSGVHGLRFARVDASSPMSLLGIRSGDVVQTINGFDVTNPEDALVAYGRLRLAQHLTVTMLRGGKVQNLDYDISE